MAKQVIGNDQKNTERQAEKCSAAVCVHVKNKFKIYIIYAPCIDVTVRFLRAAFLDVLCFEQHASWFYLSCLCL